MPFSLPPHNQSSAQVRQADAASIKRLADAHKRQQEAEERRRRDERNRAIAAEARLKASSTSQKK